MARTSGRKVILDKSFLQAESRACRRLGALRQCGCTFVLTDTLVYELCTGNRESLWPEAQRKLFNFAGSIEVWRHTGELLRQELAAKAPIEHPLDEDLTERTRRWFRSLKEYVPGDLRRIAESARQQREVDSVEVVIRLCRTFCDMCAGPYGQVRRDLAQREDMRPQMDALVNDDRILKHWIQLLHDVGRNWNFISKKPSMASAPIGSHTTTPEVLLPSGVCSCSSMGKRTRRGRIFGNRSRVSEPF